MENVIFLDHDGVLNNNTHHDNKKKITEVGIINDTDLLTNFKKLVRECIKMDIKIVSSSGYMFITDISNSYRKVIPNIDKILIKPNLDAKMNIDNDEFRSKFFRELYNFNNIKNYLIIDDYPELMSDADKQHLVITNQLQGLNSRKLKEVLHIIKRWK